MKEFLEVSIPFIIMGISVALICVNTKKNKDNYLTYGMIYGVSFGLLLATSFKFNLGLGVSLGMLVGEAVGSFIKRK